MVQSEESAFDQNVESVKQLLKEANLDAMNKHLDSIATELKYYTLNSKLETLPKNATNKQKIKKKHFDISSFNIAYELYNEFNLVEHNRGHREEILRKFSEKLEESLLNTIKDELNTFFSVYLPKTGEMYVKLDKKQKTRSIGNINLERGHHSSDIEDEYSCFCGYVPPTLLKLENLIIEKNNHPHISDGKQSLSSQKRLKRLNNILANCFSNNDRIFKDIISFTKDNITKYVLEHVAIQEKVVELFVWMDIHYKGKNLLTKVTPTPKSKVSCKIMSLLSQENTAITLEKQSKVSLDTVNVTYSPEKNLTANQDKCFNDVDSRKSGTLPIDNKVSKSDKDEIVTEVSVTSSNATSSSLGAMTSSSPNISPNTSPSPSSTETTSTTPEVISEPSLSQLSSPLKPYSPETSFSETLETPIPDKPNQSCNMSAILNIPPPSSNESPVLNMSASSGSTLSTTSTDIPNRECQPFLLEHVTRGRPLAPSFIHLAKSYKSNYLPPSPRNLPQTSPPKLAQFPADSLASSKQSMLVMDLMSSINEKKGLKKTPVSSPTRNTTPPPDNENNSSQKHTFNSDLQRIHHHHPNDVDDMVKKVITWLNNNLKSNNISVDNIESDLSDGLLLIYALENCTGEQIKKHVRKPMVPLYKLENINNAIIFLLSKGVQVGSVSSNDIMNGNMSMILVLFSHIMRTYPL